MVYFRILLKRGQTYYGKFHDEANPNPRGGGGNTILHVNIGKPIAKLGEGGEQKHPLASPEINPTVILMLIHVCYIRIVTGSFLQNSVEMSHYMNKVS